MNRRGFTLTEIIIALVLSGIVGTGIVRMMNSSSRLTRVQYGRIESQQAMLSAAYYMSSALRELDASEGDVQSASSTAIVFRGMRWTAITCSAFTVSGSDMLVTVKNSQMFGARVPDIALDSLLVFSENDPDTRSDDSWLFGWLTAATSAVNCADGTPGTQFTFRITAGSGNNAACVAGCTKGSPIRGFQIEELALTTVSGVRTLTRRTKDLAGTWTAKEDIAGPLSASGLEMQYRDTLNNSTGGVLNRIAVVRLTLRTVSTANTGTSAGVIRDSLLTRIALRNNKRF